MSNTLDREKQGFGWQGALRHAQHRQRAELNFGPRREPFDGLRVLSRDEGLGRTIANYEFNELNNSRTQ